MKALEFLFDSPEQWFKGNFCDARGEEGGGDNLRAAREGRATRYCILGRMARKNALGELSGPYEVYVDRAIIELFPGRVTVSQRITPDFNDHKDTTFDDVQKVLRRASELMPKYC